METATARHEFIFIIKSKAMRLHLVKKAKSVNIASNYRLDIKVSRKSNLTIFAE